MGGSRLHRRRVLFVVCLALSLAVALGLAHGAWGVTYGPSVKPLGPEETVFDYQDESTGNLLDACQTWDIPDQPARGFKDDQNRVHLHFDIAPNQVFRNIGTSLDDASKSINAGQGRRHDCGPNYPPSIFPVAVSGGEQDPAKFDGYEWLTSFYTLDGHTIYSLSHEEWRGWQVQDPYYCPLPPDNDTTKCWYNALVLYASTNSGDWFDRNWSSSCCPPPSHLVASVPHKWVNQTGPYGTFQPSNIIRKQPDDGYLYTMIRAKEPGKADVSCLMRTPATAQDLGNPTSWRAWGDGPDPDSTDSFEIQFVNPYTYNFTATDTQAMHMCKGIGAGSIGSASESLTYNTYFGKYMLIGVRGGSSPGFFYSLSDDLINWSPAQTVLEREVQFSYQCRDPDPVIAPSLLDPTSATRNFETTGRDAYLYFALFHPDNCQFGPNRDLIRVPLRFSKAPTASLTVSPNPASTGQTVTFNASASTDSDGTIAKYEWDLDGNGSFETDSGTTPTTTRSYPAGGTVLVKLKVTDNDGAWNDTTRNLTITGASNQVPTASFTVSPNPAQTGQVVTFNGSTSSDPEGPISNYKWDLDGNGSFETDGGTTATTSRSYSTAGSVTVKLRVTDSNGLTNDTTRPLTVNNRPPTASFTVSPNPASVGAVVTFNGSASSDSDGTITNYKWDLDGNGILETDTGTTPLASHSYDAEGTLTLQLQVTDNNGASKSVAGILTVNGSPLQDPFPAPFPAPIATPAPSAQSQSSTKATCEADRIRRIARLRRQLRSARRSLARTHRAAAKRVYRSRIKKLTKRLKRLRETTC